MNDCEGKETRHQTSFSITPCIQNWKTGSIYSVWSLNSGYSYWGGDKKWTQRGGSGGVGSAPHPFFLMLVTWAVLFLKIQAGHFFTLVWVNISSVQFSCSVMSDSLRPHESQHTRPPCPSSTPGVHPDSRPSSQWCHPAISSSVVPFSCPSPSQHQSLFQWVNSSHEVAKVLEFQLQHHSFQRNPRADLL